MRRSEAKPSRAAVEAPGVKILVTGATGFIGGRLARRLVDDGFDVRCLTRDPDSDYSRELADIGCELAVADLTRSEVLPEAMDGVSIAYFLVHMIGADDDYPATELAAARQFARAATDAGVDRVIYLGGLGDGVGSRHLSSRAAVADALRSEGPPLTYFRAGMVIGAGSESYALLRGIARRLRALPAPEWLDNETQPIGVDDVVDYLRAAIDVEESAGREIQIGGPDVASYLELVERMSRAMGESPPRTLRMSGRIARPRSVAAGAAAVTPGTPAVARELGLGLDQPTVVTDPGGAELFDIRPRRLDDVLADAVAAESNGGDGR
ncbi:MAG: NmrA family NAD(P)-binding protein [Solirubrobacterales bacterium]